MRGEDLPFRNFLMHFFGSPPHARGRPGHSVHVRAGQGITPACAGKTAPFVPMERAETGSPPHARGRLVFSSALPCVRGITPACAGKTLTALSNRLGRGDHPRMRGEDGGRFRAPPSRGGSPPHARGRLVAKRPEVLAGGITPACAGKTRVCTLSLSPIGDHPRMRGEDRRSSTLPTRREGSPPHARGRPSARCTRRSRLADHPRMRGED